MAVDDLESDEQVIRRVIAGDSETFRLLVLRHQSKIFRLLVRQVRDREVAAELTQDVFVRAFKGIRLFRFDSSFSTWLTRIALNVANSYFSSRSYRERRRTESYGVELPSTAHAELPQEAAAAKSEAAAEFLQRVLGSLPAKYREPLVLCRLERKSYREAAELLGIPEGTVCSRINSALGELRRKLTKLL